MFSTSSVKHNQSPLRLNVECQLKCITSLALTIVCVAVNETLIAFRFCTRWL